MRYLSVALVWGTLFGCGASESENESTSEESASEEPAAAVEPVAEVETEHEAGPDGPFTLVSSAQLHAQIDRAVARAADRSTRVLLEFGANWCPDCREVHRIAQLGAAAEVLARDYEVVQIDVGHFDVHEALRQRYDVRAIATLVVLDGQGERVAQTTLEPLSREQPLSPDALAAWLRNPQDGS